MGVLGLTRRQRALVAKGRESGYVPLHGFWDRVAARGLVRSDLGHVRGGMFFYTDFADSCEPAECEPDD